MGTVTVADDIITGHGTSWGAPSDLELPSHLYPASGAPQYLVQPRPGDDGRIDVDMVGIALQRAVERLLRVTFEGVEVSEEEMDELSSYDVPEGVSGPLAIEGGLYLKADTRSDLTTPMLETMAAIIVDELERAGASAHLSVGPDVAQAWSRPRWQPGDPAA